MRIFVDVSRQLLDNMTNFKERFGHSSSGLGKTKLHPKLKGKNAADVRKDG